MAGLVPLLRHDLCEALPGRGRAKIGYAQKVHKVPKGSLRAPTARAGRHTVDAEAADGGLAELALRNVRVLLAG